MPAPRPSSAFLVPVFPCGRRPARSLIQIALVIIFITLFVTALVFPSQAFASGTAEPQPGTDRGLRLKPIEYALMVPIALLLAFMGLYKDFRSYRGLLHILIWNFYSWLFLAFTAMFIFAIDYVALLQLQKLPSSLLPGLMQHMTLAIGHTTVSAAFAYMTPFMLRVIPTQSNVTPAAPAATPPQHKPATEMNVIYAAIRESLENNVNGKVSEWTFKYSWTIIRSTGRRLLTDLHRSGAISQEEFDCAKTLESSYLVCTDPGEDRDVKYDLLRLMMSRSSYYDLSTRLERAAKAERAGTTL